MIYAPWKRIPKYDVTAAVAAIAARLESKRRAAAEDLKREKERERRHVRADENERDRRWREAREEERRAERQAIIDAPNVKRWRRSSG